jgi:orotate phosphoribosyltransferase
LSALRSNQRSSPVSHAGIAGAGPAGRTAVVADDTAEAFGEFGMSLLEAICCANKANGIVNAMHVTVARKGEDAMFIVEILYYNGGWKARS